MELNKKTFEKALKANKIIRYQKHFEAVVKSYLEIENQALRQLPFSGELAAGWISVNDKLPTVKKDYLVTDGSACMVATFKLEKKEWDFWTIGWWSNDIVTHWMPLPSIPACS